MCGLVAGSVCECVCERGGRTCVSERFLSSESQTQAIEAHMQREKLPNLAVGKM